ncbi:tRNA pseudouridine(13) synthase TruD [Leucobacter allii]|uniref:tRNA pseudouridine(13) synthase TruD n=1 Tax=Leucobacter allii TaxID=2932247 RepID=A0ABY4FQL7_9MICO|nr:tRNA pseudouridine(13) synthase TruD [Leucobacter allii]UOQ58586.1 tRNA pseudouridine(13) synthase TruD [Leucobacter allii]
MTASQARALRELALDLDAFPADTDAGEPLPGYENEMTAGVLASILRTTAAREGTGQVHFGQADSWRRVALRVLDRLREAAGS